MAEDESELNLAPEEEDEEIEEDQTEELGYVEKTCQVKIGKPFRKYKDIPVVERLTISRGSRLDSIFDKTPRPPGAVPEPFLPSWPEIPMAQKIPGFLQVPKDTLLLSRGKIGTGLIRPVTSYTTEDPHNEEKVVRAPYTALHDPNAKNAFQAPWMRDLMIKNNLITPDGKVICSLKEFYDFRRYLNKRIYLSQVDSNLQEQEKVKDLEKKQIASIKKYLSKTEGALFKVAQRVEKAKELQKEKMDLILAKFDMKQAETEMRLQLHEQMIESMRQERMERSCIRENAARLKVAYMRENMAKRQKQLQQYVLYKERKAAEFLASEKQRKAEERQQFLTDWLGVRCAAQIRANEKNADLRRTIAATMKDKAIKRQIKAQEDIASLPAKIEARKADEERIWGLVRKFFYRWLDKVRQRRARRPDALHLSFWHIPTVMDETVKYLRKESGYEKFDDFIMNIVKLKRDIKAELESEEQAEAAALLGLEVKNQTATKEGEEEETPPPQTKPPA